MALSDTIPSDSFTPHGALADWLRLVAGGAGALRKALAAEQVPDDFPRGDLDAIAAALDRVPDMTAHGALSALLYAQSKLSEIRQRWIAIPNDGENWPVTRNGPIDRTLVEVIAGVGTALECYSDPEREAAAASPVPETLVVEGRRPEFMQLAGMAAGIADRSGQVADELARGATPASGRADSLVRGVRDVAVLKREEAVELRAEQPRIRRLDLLNGGVARSAAFTDRVLEAVDVDVDFSGLSSRSFETVDDLLDRSWSGCIEATRLIETSRGRWSVAAVAGAELRVEALRLLVEEDGMADFPDAARSRPLDTGRRALAQFLADDGEERLIDRTVSIPAAAAFWIGGLLASISAAWSLFDGDGLSLLGLIVGLLVVVGSCARIEQRLRDVASHGDSANLARA